jgi:hypothetical protein
VPETVICHGSNADAPRFGEVRPLGNRPIFGLSEWMEVSMRVFGDCVAGSLVAVTMLCSSAAAQDRHVVPSTSLADAVAEHVSRQDDDRAAVREALTRPEVRDIAGRIGLDLSRSMMAVDTLAGADLERAAAAAREVNRDLVGGASSVTISTTTIIIALLVIILIIVAVS